MRFKQLEQILGVRLVFWILCQFLLFSGCGLIAPIYELNKGESVKFATAVAAGAIVVWSVIFCAAGKDANEKKKVVQEESRNRAT